MKYKKVINDVNSDLKLIDKWKKQIIEEKNIIKVKKPENFGMRRIRSEEEKSLE